MSRPVINDKDVDFIILQAVGTKAVVLSYKVKPFSVHRNGIMGNHHALTIDYIVESASPQTINLFVKTPSNSDPIADDWVVEQEIQFFTEVYPLLIENCRGERWCPKCYLARRDILVFEDLRIEGFAVRKDSIYNEESLKVAVATLARFHAATYALETKSNKSLKSELGPEAFREKIFTSEGKGGQGNRLGFETLCKLAGERFKFKDVDVLVSRIMDRVCELVKPNNDSLNVICHGDLWRNNIMFDDTVSPPRCVLVDYQMLRYASPACDLVMLLFVHAGPESRENVTDTLLRHYHIVLRETLLLAGVEESKIPEFERIQKEYEDRRLLGMAYAALRWPKIVYREVIDDPVKLRDWYFHDRIVLYGKAMDEDANYEEKMKRCVEELLEEGRRVLNV